MKKLYFLAIFTAIALTVCAQKNPVELRLNLEKGKTYTQTTDIQMNMKMEVMGMKMDTDIPMSMTFSMKVVDIQDGNFIIETTYDAFKMTFNIMGQEMGFDSANPDPTNPNTQIFSSFIGKSFTMILDNRQNIIAIEGLDKLLASIYDNETVSEEQKELMNDVLQGFFSEEKMKENFGRSNIVFPKEPVYKGFTWTSDQTINMQGITMQVKNTYKVEKITATTVEISLVSDYTMDMSITQNEVQMNVTMESAQSTGKYIIDLATGWTQSAQSNTNMKMVMTMNVGGTEMIIPAQITAKMTMK